MKSSGRLRVPDRRADAQARQDEEEQDGHDEAARPGAHRVAGAGVERRALHRLDRARPAEMVARALDNVGVVACRRVERAVVAELAELELRVVRDVARAADPEGQVRPRVRGRRREHVERPLLRQRNLARRADADLLARRDQDLAGRAVGGNRKLWSAAARGVYEQVVLCDHRSRARQQEIGRHGHHVQLASLPSLRRCERSHRQARHPLHSTDNNVRHMTAPRLSRTPCY
eukprot:2450464-Prymnesium_polylepis.1